MGKIYKKGRPKKEKRGGGRHSTPGGYSSKTKEEQKLYKRDIMRKSRGFIHKDESQNKKEPSRLARHDGVFSRDCPPSSTNARIGRPPLDPDSGAMDAEALMERRRALGRQGYKEKKISILRREAVMKRRATEAVAGHTMEGTSGDHDDANNAAGGEFEFLWQLTPQLSYKVVMMVMSLTLSTL